MILVVTGWFDIYDKQGYPTGKKEFSISHGIDLKSGHSIVMSGGHPTTVGAKFDTEMQEWVIYDHEEEFASDDLATTAAMSTWNTCNQNGGVSTRFPTMLQQELGN